MKKLITMFAVGALAAGSAFADKEKGDRPEGAKPKGERPERGEGERKRPEGRRGPGEMIKALDKDENGSVSFAEFKASPRAEGKEEEKVKAFFDKMDKDGDGNISPADLAAIRKEMEDRRKAQGDKPKRPEGERGDRPKRPEGGDRPERPKKPEGDKPKGE